MAFVTIIVPVYGVEDYLPKCLDSILAQTFQDYDVILVDDGSPDGCPAICDTYVAKSPKFHVIHKENGGVSSSRNVGLRWAFEKSDSQYLTFIDSDDWVHPRYLELLKKALEESGCGISMGYYVYTDAYSSLPIGCKETFHVMTPEEEYCKAFGTFVVPTAKLFPKKDFANLRFPMGKIHEDEYTIWKILFQYQKLAVLDSPVYAYYQRPGSIMRQEWSPAKLVLLDAMEEEKAWFLQQGREALVNKIRQRLVKICTDQVQGMKRTGYDPEQIALYQKRLRVYMKEAKGLMGFQVGILAYGEAYPFCKPLVWCLRIPYRMQRKLRHLLKRVEAGRKIL